MNFDGICVLSNNDIKIDGRGWRSGEGGVGYREISKKNLELLRGYVVGDGRDLQNGAAVLYIVQRQSKSLMSIWSKNEIFKILHR